MSTVRQLSITRLSSWRGQLRGSGATRLAPRSPGPGMLLAQLKAKDVMTPMKWRRLRFASARVRRDLRVRHCGSPDQRRRSPPRPALSPSPVAEQSEGGGPAHIVSARGGLRPSIPVGPNSGEVADLEPTLLQVPNRAGNATHCTLDRPRARKPKNPTVYSVLKLQGLRARGRSRGPLRRSARG